MNSNVQYLNTLPRKRFPWKKAFLIVAILGLMYLLIFQPYLVGETIGHWLKLLTDGFKSKFV